MATIYKTVGGRPLEDYIAHMPGVVEAVGDEAERIKAIAESIFAQHDRPGGSYIDGGRDGITDSYIYLVSPEGIAHIIEYGRRAYVTKEDRFAEGRLVPAGTIIGSWDGTHVLQRTYEAA
jgi:hypothetical protein